MPIATLEAMRAGLACVASDLPGVHVLFGDPPAGVVAGDDEGLRAAVSTLVADRQRVRELGELARHRYEQAFSADAMAVATQRVYDEVLSPVLGRDGRSAGSTGRTAG
jgi:glycosyltransferase involved in cell wall biosynthesis